MIERAHLKDPRDESHVIYRYEPDAEFDGLLRRFWVPVWSVPPGREAPQKVLQYPVCLIVVSAQYARFYGVVSGLSTTTLTGDGWAVGLMLAPAAGFRVADAPVAAYTDSFVDVTDVLGASGERLVERVRGAMAGDPHATDSHHSAMQAYGDALRMLLPVDAEGSWSTAWWRSWKDAATSPAWRRSVASSTCPSARCRGSCTAGSG